MFIISPWSPFSFPSAVWVLSYWCRRGNSLKDILVSFESQSWLSWPLEGKEWTFERQAVRRKREVWIIKHDFKHMKSPGWCPWWQNPGYEVKKVESPSFQPGWRKASQVDETCGSSSPISEAKLWTGEAYVILENACIMKTSSYFTRGKEC